MKPSRSQNIFTLIELVVVMALLATVMAVSSPALRRFFQGRSLTGEARRLLALTRYSRSEAASRGTPMKLWIDPNNGLYGLEPLPGYGTEEDKIEFRFADDVTVLQEEKTATDKTEQATILFRPDGTVDPGSTERLVLQGRWNKNHRLTIVRDTRKQRYVIEQ